MGYIYREKGYIYSLQIQGGHLPGPGTGVSLEGIYIACGHRGVTYLVAFVQFLREGFLVGNEVIACADLTQQRCQQCSVLRGCIKRISGREDDWMRE